MAPRRVSEVRRLDNANRFDADNVAIRPHGRLPAPEHARQLVRPPCQGRAALIFPSSFNLGAPRYAPGHADFYSAPLRDVAAGR